MRNVMKTILASLLGILVASSLVYECRSRPIAETKPQSAAPLPATNVLRLVDLGATKCIPCKMMAPILEELRRDYTGRMDVVFYDVWENPAMQKQFGIRMIPTQVFIGPDGKELFRHEGFYAKDDILKKWKELGFPLLP